MATKKTTTKKSTKIISKTTPTTKKATTNKSTSVTGSSGKLETTQPEVVPSFTYSAPAAYSSQYAGQIDAALNNVTNFKYDPLQDASYKALAKVYTANGDRAAKSSMADAAALNGGYGTSYAASAGQQMRNQYNSELASSIPELE